MLHFALSLVGMHSNASMLAVTKIGKDEKNKFGLYKLPNRKGWYHTAFPFKKRLSCENTKFQNKAKTMDLH